MMLILENLAIQACSTSLFSNKVVLLLDQTITFVYLIIIFKPFSTSYNQVSFS